MTKKGVMRCQDRHDVTRGKTSVFPVHYVKDGEIMDPPYYGYKGIPIRAAAPIPVIPGHQAEAAAAETAAQVNEDAARVAEAANDAARVAEQAAEIARLEAALLRADDNITNMTATARDNSRSFAIAMEIAAEERGGRSRH